MNDVSQVEAELAAFAPCPVSDRLRQRLADELKSVSTSCPGGNADSSRLGGGAPRSRSRSIAVRLVGAATLATLAGVAWLMWPEPPSSWAALSDAIRATDEASAVRILESYFDPIMAPNEAHAAEAWYVRDVGWSRTSRVNGKVSSRTVSHRGVRTRWQADSNEVEIETEPGKYGTWRCLTVSRLFLEHMQFERRTKEQGVRMQVDQFQIDGKPIRRIQIDDLPFVDEGRLTMTGSYVIEVDVASGRITRLWARERFRNSDEKGSWESETTTEKTFSYPDPASLDPKLFSLTPPDNAKVIRR